MQDGILFASRLSGAPASYVQPPFTGDWPILFTSSYVTPVYHRSIWFLFSYWFPVPFLLFDSTYQLSIFFIVLLVIRVFFGLLDDSLAYLRARKREAAAAQAYA